MTNASRMKIKLVLGAISAAVFSSQVIAYADNANFQSGCYLGAQTGLETMRLKIDSVYNPDLTIVPLPPYEYSRKSKSDSQVVLSGFIGWRYLTNSGFMPGIELATAFADHKIETYSTFSDFAFPIAQELRFLMNRNSTLIPAITLGWVIKQKVNLFVKLGCGFSRFKTTILNPNTFNGAVNGPVAYSRTSFKTAFVPGIGIEYGITSTFSALATLDWELLGNIKQQSNHIMVPPPVPGQVTYVEGRYKPSVVSGKIGFIYKIKC